MLSLTPHILPSVSQTLYKNTAIIILPRTSYPVINLVERHPVSFTPYTQVALPYAA